MVNVLPNIEEKNPFKMVPFVVERVDALTVLPERVEYVPLETIRLVVVRLLADMVEKIMVSAFNVLPNKEEYRVLVKKTLEVETVEVVRVLPERDAYAMVDAISVDGIKELPYMVEKMILLVVRELPERVEKETVHGVRVEIHAVEVVMVLPNKVERTMVEALREETVVVLTRRVE